MAAGRTSVRGQWGEREVMLAIVVKQDTTLFVVLSHDGHEIERCVCASPNTAVAAAIRIANVATVLRR